MRKTITFLGGLVALSFAPLSASADQGRASSGRKAAAERRRAGSRRVEVPCGKTIRRGADAGYKVIFDGSRRCFARWRYAGGSMITLQRDGTLKTEPGPPNLGVLWYAGRPYGDFSLRLQFRDDSPVRGTRANSGVQVRFPAPKPPVPGCPMTFNGSPQTENPAAWIAVNCGHEIQINDSPDDAAQRPAQDRVDLRLRRHQRDAGAGHAARRVERARDPRRRPALHRHPQRGGDQRVRERARRPVPGPAERPGLEFSRARGLRRAAVARRAAGRGLVPQHPIRDFSAE